MQDAEQAQFKLVNTPIPKKLRWPMQNITGARRGHFPGYFYKSWSGGSVKLLGLMDKLC